MARTKEAVDITPGVKSKEFKVGAVQGVKLDTPLVGVAEWTVPTVDELVNLLSTNPDSVLSEIASARQADAIASAKAKLISDNEPREVKVSRLAEIAVKKFGLAPEAALAMAEANIPQ